MEMSFSNEANYNFVNANLYQNRSQTESAMNGISVPSLNGTLSQRIANYDICIAYNRDNGYSTASLLKERLSTLANLQIVLYAEEKEPFDLITVESRIASSSSLIVVLSMGAVKSVEVLFALSAADYYYSDEAQVLMIHDAASCFIPGYQEQPPQFRKYFGDRVLTFFTTYAQQGCQEILRRYEASKEPTKRSPKKGSTEPVNTISLGIQEALDSKPTKQEAPKRTTSTTQKSSYRKPSSLGHPSTAANLNNNGNTDNNLSAVSEDPPHYFFPFLPPASSTTSNNSNNSSNATSTTTSDSSTRPSKRIPSLKSLSRDRDLSSEPSSTTTTTHRTRNSASKPPFVPSNSTSSVSTKPSSTNRRSSNRTEVPQSTGTIPNNGRRPRRSSSGEVPSLGNIGVYPPSTSSVNSTVQENFDLEAIEDAELRLALELSKVESETPIQPTQPPPNTEDDERIARALQEQWNSGEVSRPVRTIVQESPTRNALSDEMLALMLQDSENAPLHLEPVYNDTDSDDDLPSGYDLLDAPPIPLFPGHAFNPYFTHTQQHHPPMHYSSNSHRYGNQVDVDNMSYEELLELEERMGKAKSEGATKQQISALPTRKVTKISPDSKCSVCQCEYELGQQVTSLPCFHSYHSECIENWLTRKKTCPECLKEIEF